MNVMLSLFTVLIISAARLACADAKLQNFDIPANQGKVSPFGVVFKKPSELYTLASLYRDPSSGVTRPSVLPDILPISLVDTTDLANALAASVGGFAVLIVASNGDLAGQFDVKGVTDDAVKALAKDPRIEVISGDAIAYPDTNQKTLKDPLGYGSGN
jgi:hypothetical protein